MPATGSLLIDRIGQLSTCDPLQGDGVLGQRPDMAVACQDGLFAWIGPSAQAPECDQRLDAAGAAVVPGFVDSHSHLVFAGDRSAEFAARMSGQPYQAGGIRTTVTATRAATDAELLDHAARLVAEALSQGTTTIEVKSGYGLSVADEVRSLRVAGRVSTEVTFLGAHVVPSDTSAQAYVDLVTGPMLAACAPLARWIDVFVDDGAFDADAGRAVLTAGIAVGLQARVHANQLGPGAGASLACEVGAASADHCTHVSDTDLDHLATAGVVATLLPGAELSTRSPFPDARRFQAAGVTMALASDCNPGTSFTTSMPLMIALGVTQCHLSPDQAVWAATAGGAAALRRSDIGRIAVGARADLVVLAAPSAVHLAYRPGVPLVDSVVHAGRIVA
ncbi:MAG: imidazolonepropionase [Euzebya sp.]